MITKNAVKLIPKKARSDDGFGFAFADPGGASRSRIRYWRKGCRAASFVSTNALLIIVRVNSLLTADYIMRWLRPWRPVMRQ
jgi:hypothetical protein